MAGKNKKRKLVPPNSNRVATPVNIQTRYDFNPRPTTEIPPPEKPTRQVSLRDYPPPKQLFVSTTAPQTTSQPSPVSQSRPAPLIPPQASANRSAAVANDDSPVSDTRQRSEDSLSRPIQPIAYRPAQPTQTNQSPHSSQAQNSHCVDEDTDEEGYPQPNLSQAQQEALNSLLLAPRPKKITILDPDLLEEGSTW